MKKTCFALSFIITFQTLALGFGPVHVGEVQAARAIVFPVIGPSSYTNDYLAPRGTRTHHAIDIIADKRQPLVAVVSGTIIDVQYPQPSWGYSVTIRDDDGYEYTYIHMNDDTAGTNDGQGGGMGAYAIDVNEGNRVTKGQLIGRVGDSGWANGIAHLHFEMYLPNGEVVNPYNSLLNAKKLSRPIASYPRLSSEILPYGSSFKGGASIDYGNVDADGEEELITGARKGGRPYLQVFEHNAVTPSKVFYAFNETFVGGIDVAAGDVDGDGVDELIAGAGPGGNPTVKIFKRDGTLLGSFDAYASGFRGGVNVAAGDVDGDGTDEIITGAGYSGGPRVTVRKLNQAPLQDYYVYNSTFRGGVDVASGDIEGNSIDEIIIGLGPGGAPRVRALTLSGSQKLSFLAFEGSFTGGVRLSSANMRMYDLAEEIVVVPATKAGPRIKMFNGLGSVVADKYFFEEWWRGATYDVAAGQNISKASAGENRRTTVRYGVN